MNGGGGGGGGGGMYETHKSTGLFLMHCMSIHTFKEDFRGDEKKKKGGGGGGGVGGGGGRERKRKKKLTNGESKSKEDRLPGSRNCMQCSYTLAYSSRLDAFGSRQETSFLYSWYLQGVDGVTGGARQN